jgi:glutamate carboxypeptidase
MPTDTNTKQKIIDWLAGSKSEMLDLLERLVNIDSWSYDKAGVDRVGEEVAEFLTSQGIDVARIPVETHGDSFRASVGAAAGNRPIMMMGHRDTVFPTGEVAKRPFKIDGNRAYGPGVADMKSGLVINTFVLLAFHKFGGAPAPLVALYTGDEEIGSPTSRPIIESAAREARLVFNSEPGRPSGNVVTGRKGGVFMRCEVTGVAAHSGGNYEMGRSAIEELARKIQAWHKLTDLKAGITVNIGLIEGGQSVNTVAPHAKAEIDLRYVRLPQREAAVSAIREIAETCSVPDTSATLEILGEFNPLNQTPEAKALFEHYVAAASEAGLKVAGEFSGGCADSGFTAAVGTPTICATGPVGGNAHSPEEYLEIETIVPRAQAMAISIIGAGALLT